METSACGLFVKKVKQLYTVESLDEFLSWNESNGAMFFSLIIKDKHIPNQTIVESYIRIDPEKKVISLLTFKRFQSENIRETYYKGLGKIIIYLLICKAIELRYSISLRASWLNDGGLVRYYKSLGFQRQGNTQLFEMKPTQAEFEDSIQRFTMQLKNTSALQSYLFKPVWEVIPKIPPARYDTLLIKCPLCGNAVNYTYSVLTHKEDCPNKNKFPDISEKPKIGGKRCSCTKKRRNRSRYTLRKN